MQRFNGKARTSRTSLRTLVLGMALTPVMMSAAMAASSTWLGTTSTDWNDATNWSGGVLPSGTAFPDGVATINIGTGNYPIVTADIAAIPTDVELGLGVGNTGRIDVRAGTVTQNGGNWTFIGNNGGTGILNLADTSVTGTGISGYGLGSGSWAASGNMYIGGRYFGENGGASGTVNINTTGSLTANLFDVYDNNDAPGTGVVNLEAGTVNSLGEFWVGAWGTGTGTFNQTGGTVNTGSWMAIGRGNHDGGTGTYNISGGVINATNNNGNVTIGSFGGAVGVMNISGTAQVNSAHGVWVGESGNATLNVNGGTLNIGASDGLRVALNTNGTGVANLNAGASINTKAIGGGGGNSTVNFNGAAIKVTASNTNFMSGIKHAVIKSGLNLNTDGKDISTAQVLEHDASGPAIDGGVTKTGAGTWTMGGAASTYTGPTVISGGTLKLASGGPPQAVARYTFDELADGALAGGTAVANSGTGGIAMVGTVNHADNAFDPINGGAAVVAGHTGKALNLDGFGSSVDIASQIVDQSGGASWTMSAWISTTTVGSSWVSKDDGNAAWSNGDTVAYLATNPPGGTGGSYPTMVRYAGGFLQGDPGATSLTDGTWHMVTFVDNSGTKTIYVDGVAITTLIPDVNSGDPSTLVRLGFNLDTLTAQDGASNMTGAMDEVQFFDSALNATQVSQLFSTNTVTSGVGSQQYLPVATALSLAASGTAFDMNNNNQTIGSLAGVAGTNVTLGSAILSTGGNNGSTTFAGVIAGTGKIVKEGSGTMTLTGANTYSGGTQIDAGTLDVGPAAQAVVLGSAGTDIRGGKLALDYTTNGAALASQVQSILTAGYGQPSKFSSGTIKSTTLATNRTLGWKDNAAQSRIEVAYTLPGDANLDFSVNFDDLLALAQNYGPTSGKVWSQGDFNYDTGVTFDDLLALAQNYNQSLSVAQADMLGASFASDYALALSLVPEPTTLSVLALGAGALVRRNRKA